jgi:hypothetical protein
MSEREPNTRTYTRTIATAMRRSFRATAVQKLAGL